MHIITCLPGKSYSGLFLSKWTEFLGKSISDGVSLSLSQNYSPNIYYSRNLCLNGNIIRGKNQLPFLGKKYDYILWIDSDNVPEYDNLSKLLNRNVNICAGIYKMVNGKFATVKNWDTSKITQNGEMDFMSPSDIKGDELIKVAYTGMGFMLIKYGVFEKFTYPWFRPLNIDLGNIQDFATEDVFFCQRAQELGFDIYVDPTVIVKHEKSFLI